MPTLSLSPSNFTDDEIEVAEALLLLPLSQKNQTTTSESRHRPVSTRFPRWGNTKRRSVPRIEEEKVTGIDRLSPSTPLSFSPSAGDETPPPPPPPPPPRPPILKKMEQHKEWVKEQNQRIDTLSATKASLQQCVLEAKSRYQMLREANSWLKELQSKLRERMVQRQQRQLYGSALDRFPVGHHQQRRLDLNRRTEEEDAAAAAEWRREQRRAAEARKRRIELQRMKASHKIRRLR